MLEYDDYTITKEQYKFYQLDQIDLPDNLFNNVDEFNIDFNYENEYGVKTSDIFYTLFLREYCGRYGEKPPLYRSYRSKLTVDDNPKCGAEGVLLVRCKWCKNHFTPTRLQINSRLQALKGQASVGSENNFYCSEECKHQCPVYRSNGSLNPSEYQRDPSYSAQAREIVLERTDYKCEFCDSEESLEVHHIIPFKESPIEGYDIDNLIVLCSNCHKEIGHSQEGCRLQDIRSCST